ncbi:MAG: sigma-70 family RNA polymerase sigma factor [Planctomycetota bacterium]
MAKPNPGEDQTPGSNDAIPAVTVLLQRMRDGNAGAGEELFSCLYGELRSIAEQMFRSQAGAHTLQPTALVHEAYLKLLGGSNAPELQDRAHFFRLGARAMRQILINHARDRAAQKRGGGAARERLSVVEPSETFGAAGIEVVALHDELERLAELDARQAEIVELKVFGGLTTAEISEATGVSARTVELDWSMAKSWLAGRLAQERP